jgi:hypothetical protein
MVTQPRFLEPASGSSVQGCNCIVPPLYPNHRMKANREQSSRAISYFDWKASCQPGAWSPKACAGIRRNKLLWYGEYLRTQVLFWGPQASGVMWCNVTWCRHVEPVLGDWITWMQMKGFVLIGPAPSPRNRNTHGLEPGSMEKGWVNC